MPSTPNQCAYCHATVTLRDIATSSDGKRRYHKACLTQTATCGHCHAVGLHNHHSYALGAGTIVVCAPCYQDLTKGPLRRRHNTPAPQQTLPGLDAPTAPSRKQREHA